MKRINMAIVIKGKKVERPVIEVSEDFEEQLLYLIKECTSLDIDILKADKEYFKSDGMEMVRYTFSGLSDERQNEFDWFAKRLCTYFNHAINQNLN